MRWFVVTLVSIAVACFLISRGSDTTLPDAADAARASIDDEHDRIDEPAAPPGAEVGRRLPIDRVRGKSVVRTDRLVPTAASRADLAEDSASADEKDDRVDVANVPLTDLIDALRAEAATLDADYRRQVLEHELARIPPTIGLGERVHAEALAAAIADGEVRVRRLCNTAVSEHFVFGATTYRRRER